jgi:hypothetical protein
MASKVQNTRTQNTYELRLHHADIRDMMNDPDVLIYDGNVSATQPFDVVIKRANGQELILRQMNSTDTLILRFKKVTITGATDTFTDIDVINT